MSHKEIRPKMQPLAIVGIGCLFPKANNPDEYWGNIREGVDAITEIPATHWNPADYFDADQTAADMTYARRGGFIDPQDFNPLLYGLSPNNIEATDTTQLLGLVVARQALLDAGYATGKDIGDGREFDRDRTSVIMGVTGTLELVIPLGARLGHPLWRKALKDAGVDPQTAEVVVQGIADAYVPWQENSFPGLLGNVAAGRIANRFDLGGTNCVVDAACASSLSAIHLAALELNAGRVDMAITGGMDTFNDIFMYMCFSKTPALSPTGNSRPFAKNADGTILGEGLGAVILKRLEDAKRDGDKIYAVLKGMGSSSDGRGNAVYAPSVDGQKKALLKAYDEAGVTPGSIELVEAHGTGTSVGDAVEVTALSAVYSKDNEADTWCAVGSVKSMIGHTKAAAGVAGLIKAVMALKHKVLPPSIKADEPLEMIKPGSAPIYLNTIKRPWLKNRETPRRAALSALGFGGSNFHCILEEAEETKQGVDWNGHVIIVALSAANKTDLIKQLPAGDVIASWDILRHFAFDSGQAFDAGSAHRLSMVIEKDSVDVATLFIAVKDRLEQDDELEWQLPGVVYSSIQAQHKIAFAFPGQGSQYVGMSCDLVCQFPQAFAAMEEANHSFKHVAGVSLGNIVYPIPVFSEADRQQQEETLRRTQNAQAAIGAVSLAALNVLGYFGIKADIAVGHSYGELVALHAAAYYDSGSLHFLSRIRGELMNEGEGDRGSMLAVMTDREHVCQLLEKHNIDLVLANHNAPAQVVLSGAGDQVDVFLKIARTEKISVTRLPVAAAFHSSFVAAATRPFAEAIAKVAFQKNKLPVLSNTTSEPYPDSRDEVEKLLAEQLANPVRFVEQIERLYAEGITTFIEIGPGKILSGLIGAILSDKPIINIATDASAGKQQGQYDLAVLLATLAAKGIKVELDKWDACAFNLQRHEADSKPAMTIPISGANVVMSRTPRPARVVQLGTPPSAVKQMTDENQHSVVNKQPENQHSVVNKQPETNSTMQQQAPAVTTMLNNTLLQATQESILALQKMQEQTARLHQQYLEGQETAQKTIQGLLEQQRLMGGQALTSEPVSINTNMPAPEQAVTSVVPKQEDAEQETVVRDVPKQEDAEQKTVVRDVPKQEDAEQEAVVRAVEETRQQGDVAVDNLLLKVVSEKTGYPLEMLSLDMSLDTDLGIDSIKRVEILSALQEELPWSATVNPEELGTFQFLQHIVEFILAGKPASTVVQETNNAPVAVIAKSGGDFKTMLLELVAEKTGYPLEMLDLEMNLDSDLGIDSIKRVEILSAIQEKMPELPAVSPDAMASLQTLQLIVDIFDDTAAVIVPATTAPISDVLADVLLEVVADKTGYPVDMLELEMQLDSDLGIDSIKRVEILSALQDRLPGLPVVAADNLAALQTLQQIIAYMDEQTGIAVPKQTEPGSVRLDDNPGIEKESAIIRYVVDVIELNGDRQIIGFNKAREIWINEDGGELAERLSELLKQSGYKTRLVKSNQQPVKNLGALVICAPAQADRDWLLDTFGLIQSCAGELRGAKGLLVSVTTLGGRFGFDSELKGSIIQAGLYGIIKTADKEWLGVSCKSIDIDPETVSVDLIQQELFLQGPLELALQADTAMQLVLKERKIIDSHPGKDLLNSEDLIVITGGARGVTAEVAVRLAEICQCKLLLIGRSPEPEDEPEWLQKLTEAAEIKKGILDNSTKKLSPVELEKQYQAIMASREIRATLQRVEQAGAKVQYASADVAHADAIEAVINLARLDLGEVRGVIHAAGVLADRLIEDKTREQFERVYSTKVDGLENLLAATVNDNLKLIVLFSSSTARLGRKGQVDYAAANEILNKMAQRENQQRENGKILAVNWGPWDGGMVTPALKKVFEQEGIGVIDLKAGADYLIREIATDGPVETTVLAGAGSILSGISLNQTRPPVDSADFKLAFERQLSLSSYSFLRSHVMNGQAVLPVAVILEWFAHGALHLNPGMQLHGFDDFRIFKGVTLKADATIHLSIFAGNMAFRQTSVCVPVELRSNDHLHASATIVLADRYEKAGLPKLNAVDGRYQFKSGEYYQNGQLFHGQHLQGIKEVLYCSEKGIVADASAAPAPSAWMQQPIRSNWLTDPLVLDSAFQMMILWSFAQQGIASLPTAIGHYRQYQRSFPEKGARIVAEVNEYTNNRANASIEFIDDEGRLIAMMDNYECVRDGSLQSAFKENALDLKA